MAKIPEDARNLLNHLRRTATPLPMPRNIRRADAERIDPDKYVCAAKTDGQRVAILLGATEEDDVPYCALFDRAMRYRRFDLPRQAVDALQDALPKGADAFCGTFLEAERLADGALVVFDALTVAGYDVSSRPFRARLDAAAPVVRALGRGVTLKRWRPVSEMEEAHAEPGPPRDGLIFTPVEGNAGHPVWKWKSVHTLDFLLKDDEWWFGDGAELRPIGLLDIEVVADPPDSRQIAPGVYECTPAEGGRNPRRFRVAMAREDKRSPNNRVTVERTLESVSENLTLGELRATLTGRDR